MPFSLRIHVGGFYQFAPDVSGCLVVVGLEAVSTAGRAIDISMLPDLDENQIVGVLSALSRFFASDQFRSIDFEKGQMLVEHRDRSDEITFIPATAGSLREDGIVELIYDAPHK